MAEKLRFKFGNEVRELKIGESFTNPKAVAFHTIKYDFKPASVDKNKIATIDVGNNQEVSVTVKSLDGSGTSVFKGSQRPYSKECVLVIDKVTGEMTLERLSCNIQVKKTRNEPSRIPHSADRLGQSSNDRSSSSSLVSRSSTPPVGQRVSNKTKVTSGSRRPDRPITNLVPKHSPLQASPRYPSPNQQNKSPKEDQRNFNNDNHTSASASLPMLGMDDFPEPSFPVSNFQNTSSLNPPVNSLQTATQKKPKYPTGGAPSPKLNNLPILQDEIGEISDSSSSSSDGESDSDDETNSTILERNLTSNGNSNGIQNQMPKYQSVRASHLLKEDLCLSESGSDTD